MYIRTHACTCQHKQYMYIHKQYRGIIVYTCTCGWGVLEEVGGRGGTIGGGGGGGAGGAEINNIHDAIKHV